MALTTEIDSETKIEETEEKQTEQQIVDRINKLKLSYEQSTTDSRTEFADIFAVYMGKTQDVQSTPYDTKEDIPKLRTEVAYVVPQLFSGQPMVEVDGVGDEDKAISKLFEKIINYRFETIPNFYEKIEAWVKQAVVFGTSEIKVIWRFKTEKAKGTGPDGQPYEYETPVQDDPDVEIPNHLDVYFNPIIADVKDQECVIFRSVLPLADVKNNPAYDYVNEAGIRNADTLEEGASATDQYNSSALLDTDLPNAQQKATSGMVEVFELIDNDRIQTITGNKVLRDTENVYGMKNVVKLIFEPNAIPNRYEGFGVGQNTLGLGKLYYKLWNQLSTNVKMTNNPMFLTSKGTVRDKRQFVSKPGGFIDVDTQGKSLGETIQPVLFPDVKGSAFEILTKLDDEHKRASGATDLLQGSASNDTLGQDNLAQANTSQRFELIARRFKQALADVADMMLQMELTNLQSPEASILRIFPQELREQIYQVLINEKDNVKYNVKIKGETNIARNRQMESKRMVEIFNIASAVQTPEGPLLTNTEMRAMLRRVAERQGEDNVDEIIAEEGPQMQPQIDPMTGQPLMPQGEQPFPQSMPQMPDQQVMPQ